VAHINSGSNTNAIAALIKKRLPVRN